MIRNIIIDLGGVLVYLNPANTVNALRQAGVPHPDRLITDRRIKTLLNQYETGKIDTQTFRQSFREIIQTELDDVQMDMIWNSYVPKVAMPNLHFLNRLKDRYRLFLLSNVNPLHLSHIENLLKEGVNGNPVRLNQWFERAYYSCETGVLKPSADAFSLIIEENGLTFSETLFIDDTEENLAAAEQLGIRTLHVENPDRFIPILANRLNLEKNLVK